MEKDDDAEQTEGQTRECGVHENGNAEPRGNVTALDRPRHSSYVDDAMNQADKE